MSHTVTSDASAPRPALGEGPRARLHSLTGLRWFAALLVFGEHTSALALASTPGRQAPVDRVLALVFGNGQVGVGCFFVLSGFVLTWTARPGDSARAFWQRRFAKIYPVYAVSTVVAILLLAAAGQAPDGTNLALHVLLVQSWVPFQKYYFGLNPVTWSLSCEAFFYLSFPVLLLVLARARTRLLYLCAAVSVLLGFGLPYLVGNTFTVAHPGPTAMIPTDRFGGPFVYWFTYVFPGFRVLEFVVGICVALLVVRGRWRGPSLPVVLLLCLVGFVVNLHLPPRLAREAGMMVPFALLIGALAQADIHGRWSPLRSRALVFLGEISYSLYVIQLLIIVSTGPQVKPLMVRLGVISAVSYWGTACCACWPPGRCTPGWNGR